MNIDRTAFLDGTIDAHFAEETAFLAELVRVPSDTPPGDNAPHADRAAQLLEAMGFAVERHPVPAHLVEARGLRSLVNLVVRQRFGDGPVIALNAHGDAVPPGDGWTKSPYGAEVVNGRMYGRGVAVSKSDFATYTFALAALKRLAESGVRIAGTVELHFTYDEEVGGELGVNRLLGQGIVKPDFAIAAGFSYASVNAHNGCLHLEVTVLGEAAHAAMPETGADALRAAVDVLAALYALRDGYRQVHSRVAGIGSPTITIGRIEGGINTNVVPDRVRFSLDRRMIPEEDPTVVEQSLHETIARVLAGHPAIRFEIRRTLLARALKPLAGHERLASAFAIEVARVFGIVPPVPQGVPLYTDARLYGEAGVPIVIYGAGPRTLLESNAKRADENLVLEDLRGATKVVACALARLLAVQGESLPRQSA